MALICVYLTPSVAISPSSRLPSRFRLRGRLNSIVEFEICCLSRREGGDFDRSGFGDGDDDGAALAGAIEGAGFDDLLESALLAGQAMGVGADDHARIYRMDERLCGGLAAAVMGGDQDVALQFVGMPE